MKLSKSLLQTIAVAVGITAITACSDENSIAPIPEVLIENPNNNTIATPPSQGEVEKVPEYYDCPACGMG
jgi:hypothetical protein